MARQSIWSWSWWSKLAGGPRCSPRYSAPTAKHTPESLTGLINYWSNLRESLGAHYDAGKTGRLQGDWSTGYDTQYWNLSSYRENIIARAIRVCDNNPFASSIRETILDDVIGTGIRPRARVKFANGESVAGLNKILDAGWERYNDEWDATGEATFYECQRTLLREVITQGAVLTNRVRTTADSSYLQTAAQMIPILRLDTSHDAGAPTLYDDPQTAQTVFGINLDKNGRQRSYWIQGIEKPISATYMRQLYRRKMAEEFTSPPWFTAALSWLHANSELIKDRLIASRFQGLVSLLLPNQMYANMFGKLKNSDNQLELKSGRAYPYDPAQGEPKIMQADDFVKDVLIPLQRVLMHGICVSFGWSYQTITRDVTEINQAAGKINVNRDRMAARQIQRWFSKAMCQREWEWYVYRMFLEGRVPGRTVGDFLEDPWRYTQCHWQAPGWEFIDPSREAQATATLRENKLMTLRQWYAEHNGSDWQDEVDQLAEEQKYAKSVGLDLNAAKGGANNDGASSAGRSKVGTPKGDDDTEDQERGAGE